eukprot:5609878-Amphidinium_carterae.2
MRQLKVQFDGSTYGNDYLQLEAGRRAYKLKEEEGWAYGHVRQSGELSDCNLGWFSETYGAEIHGTV